MGQEILYCFKCQERVTSGDLDSSNALRYGNRVSCKKCVPDLIATLSAQEQKDLVAKVQSPAPDSRSRSGFTPRPRPVIPATRRRTAGSNAFWWAIVAVCAVALVVVAVFALSGSNPPEPEKIVAPPRPVPRNPDESPRERAAREALAKAKAVPSSNLEGQIAAFADAVRVTEGTSHYREAKEMHEGLLEMRRKALLRELAAVDERARVTLLKEEFGAAIAIYEAIRPLRAEPEWKSLVDAKVADVRKTADLAYGPLKEQAAAAKGKGAEDEVKRLRERVSRWGIADKLTDLDAHLQTIAPPAPVPVPVEVDARPWVPLFDGKTLDFLTGNGEGAWTVENGAIQHVKGKNVAGQSKRQFTNGELRIRFTNRSLEGLGFAIRQGFDGSYNVFLDRNQLALLEGRDHEVVIWFRAGEVSATLDGKETLVEPNKTPLKGHFQFNCEAGDLIIKSIEYRDDSLYDGLAGWWTFETLKAGVAPDSSGNKNDGKLVDTPVSVPGRVGNGIQLDGRRSFVQIPSTPSLVHTGPMSVSVWVKPGPHESKAFGIVEKWGDEGAGNMGFFVRFGTSGKVMFDIAAGAEGGEVSGNRVVPPHEWSHIAAVFDGSSLKVYLNGVLDRAYPTTKTPTRSSAPLLLGRGGGGGGHYFSGTMDDVRYYTRALTADEIARLAK
jgi:hypothetical protein